MKRFITNMFLYCLPLVLFFMPAAILLWSAGEFYPLSYISRLAQSKDPVVVGSAYSNFQTQYQLYETESRSPNVLALGNSHVGEFRAAFFSNPNDFYNAAHAVLSLSDFSYFVDSLPHKPKVLIVGMSQAFFNPDTKKYHPVVGPNPFAERIAWYDPFFESFFRNGGWWRVYADYANHKFALDQVFRVRDTSVKIIGLRSKVEDYGFTNDGSDYYGNVIESTSTQLAVFKSIQDEAGKVTNDDGYLGGTSIAPYGGSISSTSLTELRKFLQDCKDNNIQVVGFLPPISQLGLDNMKKYPNARYAQTLATLGPTLAAVYKEYGFDFYDFTDPASFGSSDHEMVNNEDHLSEKGYLRMFIKMAKGTPQLGSYADLPVLEAALAHATSSVEVFGSLSLH